MPHHRPPGWCMCPVFMDLLMAGDMGMSAGTEIMMMVAMVAVLGIIAAMGGGD